jgi:hypothetical protein
MIVLYTFQESIRKRALSRLRSCLKLGRGFCATQARCRTFWNRLLETSIPISSTHFINLLTMSKWMHKLILKLCCSYAQMRVVHCKELELVWNKVLLKLKNYTSFVLNISCIVFGRILKNTLEGKARAYLGKITPD